MPGRIIDEDGDLTLITNEFDEKLLKSSGLLSTKPKLYVCNVDEESITVSYTHLTLPTNREV